MAIPSAFHDNNGKDVKKVCYYTLKLKLNLRFSNIYKKRDHQSNVIYIKSEVA